MAAYTRIGPFDAGSGANVTESFWREMATYWLSSGVVDTGTLGHAVTPNAGMVLNVAAGQVNIRGHQAVLDATTTVTISAAHATNPRWDRIVARLDTVNNTITLEVVAGTAAVSPALPALTQTSATWEIPIARVYVPATDTTISADQIYDERVAVAPPPPGLVRPSTTGARVFPAVAAAYFTTAITEIKIVTNIPATATVPISNEFFALDIHGWTYTGRRPFRATIGIYEVGAAFGNVDVSWGADSAAGRVRVGIENGLIVVVIDTLDSGMQYTRFTVDVIVAGNNSWAVQPRNWTITAATFSGASSITTALDSGWTSYTPSWTTTGTPPAIGNGSLTGFYRKNGKQGTVYCRLNAGSTTTFGTGSMKLSLPSGWSAANAFNGTAFLIGTAYWQLVAYVGGGTTIDLWGPTASGDVRLAAVSATSPEAWGTSHQCLIGPVNVAL